jgi:K+-sensing histidine kinase KdpD
MWVDLALTNLIGNAEKYTPPERPIEVVFHHNGSRASILVMDNGEGLSSESYRKVWDIYHRAANPDQTVKGSGIGLALCKELIEGMQGEVWAGPRRSGGSAFALTLPSPCDVEVPHSLGTLISRGPQLREPVQAWD